MSFELKVWNANKSVLLNTITQAAAGGLVGGFRWQLLPHGDTVQMDLTGRNDRVKLPARGVVSLKVDGQAAYYGIVPDPPNPSSPDKEAAQVLGGREALTRTLMDGKAYRNMGVYQIARDVFSRLTPPSLSYDPTLIGDGTGTDVGPNLGLYYAPTSTLDEVLTGLGKSASVPGGVDIQGRVFLGRPQPAALNVAYAGQPWSRLNVQGRETVTQAVLRVATAPSQGVTGQTTDVIGGLFETISYLPASVTSVATAAEHSLYRAERAVEPPEGVSLSADLRLGTVSSSGMIDTANAFDTSSTTASTSTTETPRLDLAATGVRVIGARLRYTLSKDAKEAYLNVLHLTDTGFVVPADQLSIPLEPSDTVREVTIIAPPSAYMAARGPLKSIGQVQAFAPAGTTNVLSVYDLSLIVVDEAAALRVAQSFLQLPYATPAELTLPGLIAPRPMLNVTGSPDGDVSGPTALWEYEHTPTQPRTTRVKLGADGQGSTARAIKFAIREGL